MTFCPCTGLRGFVTGKGGKHRPPNMPDKIHGCGRSGVLAAQMQSPLLVHGFSSSHSARHEHDVKLGLARKTSTVKQGCVSLACAVMQDHLASQYS